MITPEQLDGIRIAARLIAMEYLPGHRVFLLASNSVPVLLGEIARLHAALDAEHVVCVTVQARLDACEQARIPLVQERAPLGPYEGD